MLGNAARTTTRLDNSPLDDAVQDTLETAGSQRSRTGLRKRAGAAAVAVAISLPVVSTVAGTGAAYAAGSTTVTAAATAAAASKTVQTKELQYMRTVLPYIYRWQQAINHRDVPAALQAAEEFEAHWQGIEVYVNYRSLALYTDLEVYTQFVLEDELAAAAPDWKTIDGLIRHLSADYWHALALSRSGPALSPIFDDLARLRLDRAQLNIVRDAVGAGDVAKAKLHFSNFLTGYPPVAGLIAFRSGRAVHEISDAYGPVAAAFGNPGTPLATLQAAVSAYADRVGFGVNLVNAAARASDTPKPAVTDADKTALVALNNTLLSLNTGLAKASADPAGAAAAAATGPGSAFAAVQPALEAKTRQINTAAALRTALVNFATVVSANPKPSSAAVQTAYRTAVDQIDIARQALVGQFWADQDLQAFLAGLPTV